MKKLIQQTGQTILFISFFFIVHGCSFNAPLNTLYYKSEKPASQKNLIIFLRGRGSDHRDFELHGFVKGVRNRKLPFDMAAPNAHFGYYYSRTLVSRLKTDIIEPAKKNGYSKIWLVGLSMGGFGSLMYAREHAEDIEGIYLISPFLGYEEIIDELSDAGGIQFWKPGNYNPEEDWQRMFWHWIKQCANGEKKWPAIYLGYGTEDSFVKSHKLFEGILPEKHTISIQGGHKMDVMKHLWRLFLDKKVLK